MILEKGRFYVFSIINDNIFTLYNLYIVAIFREPQM